MYISFDVDVPVNGKTELADRNFGFDIDNRVTKVELNVDDEVGSFR